MFLFSLIAAGFWGRIWSADLWYAIPLIIAVSLVYAATRHESMRDILSHALRIGMMIAGAMAGLFVVLWLLSRWL